MQGAAARTGSALRRASGEVIEARGAWPCVPPPVILIGMHRSGTSLAAGMLSRLGAFLGAGVGVPEDPETGNDARRSGYGEDGEFFRMNELLLAAAGASWDRIDPFLARRGALWFDAPSRLLLEHACRTRLRERFLAPLRRSGAGVWGWKDPRTSLTLPYWLQVFPGARVLHVRRNPEAAAASLHRRATDWARDPLGNGAPVASSGPAFRPRKLLRSMARALSGRPAAGPLPDPCLDLDYCRELTRRYLAECLTARSLGGDYLEVWYEDLLRDPECQVDRLCEFTGCDPSPAQRDRAARLACPRVGFGC